ncbi:MAG: YoaK family protein [Devosia sp.]
MTPPAKLAIGLLFTGCAGFIDAVGFVELGGYFISFMSGNTTRLGTSIAHGEWAAAALPVALVIMFFAGGFAGSLIALSNKRWGSTAVLGLVLAVVLASVGLSLAGFSTSEAMIALAAAGGAQNAVLPPVGAAKLGTTFVTGTLFAASQDLARAVRGEAPLWRWAQHALVWGSLCAGAVVGALADRSWGIPALLAPAAIYLCFLVDFAVRAASRPSGH